MVAEEEKLLEEFTNLDLKQEKIENQKKQLPKVEIKLRHILGYTYRTCSTVKLASFKNQEYLIAACGRVIFMTNILNSMDQMFFAYHSKNVSAFDFAEGKLISVEDSNDKSEVVFNHFLEGKFQKKKFKLNISAVRVIVFSPNQNYFVVLGENKLSRDLIQIYELKQQQVSLLI